MSIPGAGLEAFVTTEETISHQGAELLGNGSGMFDAEVG
jgi:hypothetical protein